MALGGSAPCGEAVGQGRAPAHTPPTLTCLCCICIYLPTPCVSMIIDTACLPVIACQPVTH